MRHLVKLSGLAVALLVLFTACQKEETKVPDIEGVYKGTLTTGAQTKGEVNTAEAEIIFTGENEIQLHCYSENFDTTFMLNYFSHNDSTYVCYTGDDFEEMYGHGLGGCHMGGMMDDMHEGETEWMHHMDEAHEEGDEHFGGFDMNKHTFSYIFRINQDDTSYDLHFKGIKQ